MKEIVIIGAGPGGYFTALKLSSQGFRVTVVDKSFIGGTCLNVGCIPTKTLLDTFSTKEHFNDFIKKGVFEGSCNLNLEKLRSLQAEVIKQLSFGIEKLFQKNKVRFIPGEAKILSENKILVRSQEQTIELFADEIIIATGSRPKPVPTFTFDKKFILSSDDIWNIPEVPESLLIIGSGPIGIEFARVFKSLGTKVTVAEIKEFICPILDKEISENLVRSLKKREIVLKSNVASKFVSIENKKVKVEFLSTINSDKESGEFDRVLVAVGRVPNTENLGLENTGIETEPQGFIKVDKFLQTTKHHIWAIGDITPYPQLAHTASFQARVVAENIQGRKKEFDGRFIPASIYGYPEIAFVGETEESLKEKNIPYKAGKALFLASGKAKASGLTEGIAKVLMCEKTKQILGAHIIGAEASNLIHEIVIAMQNSLTVDNLLNCIHAHPTYSETLYEAIESCVGESAHA